MLTAVACALVLLPQGEYRKNLNTFMDVERSFSRMSALQGMRASFLHFFAPDGIAFNPEAHVAREELSKQPEETKPLKYLLTWDPRIADCSGKGDMGFTTGPVKLIDLNPQPKPITHMSYFSIWKRMPEGELKVVLDMGTPMAGEPVYPKQMKVRGESKPALLSLDMVDRARTVITRNEEDIKKSANPDELVETLELLYNKEMIAYRSKAMPLQSEVEALDWHRKNKLELKEWEVKKVDVSTSADFAWCWGTYSGTVNGEPARGYWAHVWKSEVGKGWHIVGDVMSILPPKR